MRILTKSLFALSLLLSFFSCKKNTNWDIDAAVPLAKSYLNISNFFGDTIFKPDTTNLLHIAFSKDIINYQMDELVKLPDTSISFSYISPLASTLTPGSQIFTNNFSTDKELTFDVPNGVQLNKAMIKSGYLKVEYFNSYAQPLNFNYFLNSAESNGSTFHINQTIQGGNISNPGTLIQFYPLNGYFLNLKGLNNTKVNTLVQTYTISTDASGQQDVLLAGQGVNIKMSFVDIIPYYVQGYFGQHDINFGPDSTQIGLLGNFTASNLQLTQANINFRIINEFGVEMSTTINSLRSIKTNPLNIVNLNAGTLLQSININRAGQTGNTTNPVFPWLKQISINTGNSNLNTFLENLPNYLGYSLKAKINPLGNISGANDFAYYGHGLKIIADVDIPLSLSANYFKLQSFSKVDLTQLRELDNVNYCDIVLQARNNYAFNAQIQGYMLNENNQVIDSLFLPGQNFINSAVTDINNVVLNYKDSRLVSSFDKAKIENLKQCKQIKFVSTMYLPNQPTPIKINQDSYLDLMVSAEVNYNVKVK